MDPVSMTASIIALLQLTTALTSYLNDFRDASSDQRKVAIEAGNLYGLLTNLRFRVEEARTDDPWFNQVKLLGVNNGPLEQFKEILEKIVEQIDKSKTKDRLKSDLAWKFKKSDVDMALQRMERLKSLIHIALSNDIFKLSQAIRDEVVDLTILTHQVQTGVEWLQTHAVRDMQTKLSGWLKLPDPSTNYHAALKKRQSGTGSWLLASQQFRDWTVSTSSLLWLHGDAGCGKTVLSATALENVIDVVGPQHDAVTGYFYFDFNDAEKQRSQGAIRSLLFQLALQLPNGHLVLEQLYGRCSDDQQQPTDDQVRSLLDDVVDQAKQTYIVLDALDECSDRGELLIFIESLMAESRSRKLCILATSRRESDIDASLKLIANQTINIQRSVVDIDIGMYVRNRLSTDKPLQKWPAAVKDEITRELMKKANGMFRWVFCQLESLCRCVKLRDLRKALSSLPVTLDETYTRILQDIESNGHLSNAVIVLRWLCFSDRPLRLSELVDVLAIKNGDNEDSGFDPEERLPDPDDIMTICSSLISCDAITRDDDPGGSQDEYSDDDLDEVSSAGDNHNQSSEMIRVRLAHFSVKEYLLSDRCSRQFDFEAGTCHAAISESCLHYLRHLSQHAILTGEVVSTYSLANYTGRRWWRHVQKLDEPLTTRVSNLIHNFLTTPEYLLTWVRLYKIEQPWKGSQLLLEQNILAAPLYYAATIGLSGLVSKIMEQGIDINVQGGYYGTALQAASAGGYEKVVQILVDANTDVNVQGGYYGTALQAASAGGYEKIVQILVDANTDVNVQGGYYGTALQAASAGGYERAVQILVDANADVNAQGGNYGTNTALYTASERGHEKVVQILVDANADVNALGGNYGTALQVASERGHEKVVQILVDAKVDLNAPGRNFATGTALYAASEQGYEKVVQILVDANADVNALGGYYGTALQAASAGGYEKAVQILVDAGARMQL